jgi:hypothetical protein
MGITLFKPEVALKPASGGARILAAIDVTAKSLPIDLLVTSGADGTHSGPTDPHLTGNAFDVAVTGMNVQRIIDVKKALETYLGPRFTVLYEVPQRPIDPVLGSLAYVNAGATGPHFHIQVVKGTVFP